MRWDEMRVLRGDESSWEARPDEEGGFCGITR